jgi:hypothetical protein
MGAKSQELVAGELLLQQERFAVSIIGVRLCMAVRKVEPWWAGARNCACFRFGPTGQQVTALPACEQRGCL